MKLLAKLLGCTALLILALVAPTFAQTVDTLDPAIKARVDRIAAQVLQQTGVPSASVAVVQHGKLVYTHAYGDARLASDSMPAVEATPEMRYSIGSISKQFTAAAMLLLQEEGKLSLDDAVGKYIPGLTRGERGDDPADSFAHVRLSGLLARGLRDDSMLHPETAQQIIDTWAQKAAGL